MLYHFVRIEVFAERMACKHVYLCRTETEAHEVVNEEVVQLVRTYKVFCLLLYVAMLVGWNQLGRDRRVDDVEQGCSRLLVYAVLCHMAHEIAYEGLRYARVHAIHRHVISVVCSPSERQFAQVARTDNHAAQLVAEIHEYLRALSCLSVLVRHVVYVYVVTNILKVLRNALANAYLTYSNAQALHKGHGVVVCAVCGTEARHRDAHNALAIVAQLVEGFNADEQGECRVKTATDANHDTLAMGVYQAFCQTAHLNTEYLVTRSVHVVALWYEWMRIDMAKQLESSFVCFVCIEHSGFMSTLGMYERGVSSALCAKFVHVYLAHHELFFQREALRLCHQGAVLIDERIAAINHVLRALAEAARTIHVAAY